MVSIRTLEVHHGGFVLALTGAEGLAGGTVISVSVRCGASAELFGESFDFSKGKITKVGEVGRGERFFVCHMFIFMLYLSIIVL